MATTYEVRVLTTLLRRMIEFDCPIALVPWGIAAMIRDDEISPPNPKHRLPEPEKWWLVKLQSSGKLLIMTEESSRLLNPTEPLDPNQFLYHERMPGSWRPRAESKAPRGYRAAQRRGQRARAPDREAEARSGKQQGEESLRLQSHLRARISRSQRPGI